MESPGQRQELLTRTRTPDLTIISAAGRLLSRTELAPLTSSTFIPRTLASDIYPQLDTDLPLLGGKGRKIVSVRVFNIQGGIKVRRIKTHTFNSIDMYLYTHSSNVVLTF